MLDAKNRAANGTCLCCGAAVVTQPTLTSPFLSARAWGGPVEWSTTSRCTACGFAFHGRGLTPAEVSRYYRGYRDETYFRDRNRFEPFYTKSVNDRLKHDVESAERKVALRSYLDRYSILPAHDNGAFTTLDFGGGTGRLISDFPGIKFVHDVSEETPVAGVTSLSEAQLRDDSFDLVVCAQMLEHATDPEETARNLLRLVKPGGHLYVEVPFDETWRDFSMDGFFRRWLLRKAIKSTRWNLVLDTYGTGFRIKFKVIPPFAFVSVKEHLNFFHTNSFRALGARIGGEVIDVSRVQLLGTTLILRKQ